MLRAMRVGLRAITVLLLVLSLGLHWALLQTVAWTGMLVAYAQKGSIAQAITKTFDGDHPCALCKVIKQGRAEEKRQAQPQAGPRLKLDCGLIWERVDFHFASAPEPVDAPPAPAAERREAPPKPRPRPGLPDLQPRA
jgi:hypothetical protein